METFIRQRLINITVNIREVRLEKNYSQDYLAMKLAISQNAYSKIELGYTKITLERLIRIADILETDCCSLLNEVRLVA